MTDSAVDRTTFALHVRDALHHLHERAVLEAHPLAPLVRPSGQTTGLTLRRILLDAIEQLRPEGGPPTRADSRGIALAPAWRRYRSLVLRYVEGRSFDEVSRELNVSSRQAFRDHAEALAALVTVLWERRPDDQTAPPPKWDDDGSTTDRLEAEVARFGRSVDAGPSSVDEALRSALQTVDELAERQQVTFAVSLPPTLPLVAVDRTVLRQILLRVLVYLAETCPRARVDVGGAAGPGCVQLGFEAGSPPGEPTLTAAGDQLRAGLAVGERLASMHGGTLVVVEGTGRPTVVELRLPPATLPTVLVVDDNPDFGRLVGSYLSGRARVVQATNAAAALRLARDVRPSVLTLDVLMPGCDGWELLRQLRESAETSAIPVVVCSILPDLDLARSLGVAGFLAKPVTRARLLTALDPFLVPASPPETADPARP